MSDLCCEYTNGISGQNRRYFTKLALMGTGHGKLYISGHGASASDLGQNILSAYGSGKTKGFDLGLLQERFRNIHQRNGRKK